MAASVLITRLVLRNYKSIAACDLSLGPLTFLVGPNGSGKSNCLDSFRFVAQSLRTSLDHALRERIGAKAVCHNYGIPDEHFAIRLDFVLPSGTTGYYSFRVNAESTGGFKVPAEECKINGSAQGLSEHFYQVQWGQVVASTLPIAPASSPDRLYLVTASGVPELRPVYDALSEMEVYNLAPGKIASVQQMEGGEILQRDGGNSASVFRRLSEPTRERVNQYLTRIVTGFSAVKTNPLDGVDGFILYRKDRKYSSPVPLLAGSMSDGTLRSLGILLALFQNEDSTRSPHLIGLEEPETGLHPAALGILLAALREASEHSQIIVTSHSPDLLDDSGIPTGSILAVENTDGETRIAGLGEAGREVVKEKLFTPGELLRQNQLTPDPVAFSEARKAHMDGIFEYNRGA